MCNKYSFNKYFLCALAVVVMSVWCMAVAQALEWKPTLERADNTSMTIDKIAGYKVYCGGSSGNYIDVWDVKGAENTSFNATFTTAGKRFCTVTQIDTGGRESKYSPEVSKDYKATIPDSVIAKPMTDFVVEKIGEFKYRISYKLPTEFTDGNPVHSMNKLYPFEHKDTDTSPRGTWQFDVKPVTDSFEITVTEGEHFYTMEVETCIDGKCQVSERSEMFVIDATVTAPPKPPIEISFESTDTYKP